MGSISNSIGLMNHEEGRAGSVPPIASSVGESLSRMNDNLIHDPKFELRRDPQSSTTIHQHSNLLYHHPVTVVEPSSTPIQTKQMPSISSGVAQLDYVLESKMTHDFGKLNLSFQAGRASAPPQIMYPQSNEYATHKMFQGNRSFGSAHVKDIHSKIELSSRTPIPSFENNPSKFGFKLSSSSTPAVENVSIANSAIIELDSHVWEPSKSDSQTDFPSRALAIFGISQLPLAEVKSTCEAFGSLLYFRSEFCSTKDVLLVAYHDLRCTRHAVNELGSYLQRMLNSGNQISLTPTVARIQVLYCVSLLTSSERDESTLVISNLPKSVTDVDVTDMMTSTRGAIRSVHFHTSDSSDSSKTYTIEFYDLQDATQALLELESTQPWGSRVIVAPRVRQHHERKRGQEMFAIMQKWRQVLSTARSETTRSTSAPGTVPTMISTHQSLPDHSSPELSISSGGFARTSSSGTGSENNTKSHLPSMQYAHTTQLVIDTNGQYSYVIVPNGPESGYGPMIPPAHYLPGNSTNGVDMTPRGYFPYWHHQSSSRNPIYHPGNGNILPHAGYDFIRPEYDYNVGQDFPSPPYLQDPMSSGYMYPDGRIPSPSSGDRSRRGSATSVKRIDLVNDSLVLDIDAVRTAKDKRTSLMIRNIPNKYTQSMLLNEFKESGHGPGKIDFFYLPIDFRNKCNRGYAFVNFKDYHDIISFYEEFNGKGWNIFKSEKICTVTYARIQGKDSMMKRFQNSSLMERNEDYRPLVFADDGTQISYDA